MPNKLEIPGAKSDILSWVPHELSTDEFNMLRNMSKLPGIYKHIALMPDCHLGQGSCVGSVIATTDIISPAICGVDIGCGMIAMKTQFDSRILDGKLPELRSKIEEYVPVGFNSHRYGDTQSSYGDYLWEQFDQLHSGVQDRLQRAQEQLGTLGGGNHFIEVCLDTEDQVWLMLHSGSRNIGKELADRHIDTAKSLHDLSELPDPDLAYFLSSTPEMAAYWHDLNWAQKYAMTNREVMLLLVQKAVSEVLGQEVSPIITVNCHHNYVAIEEHFGESVYVTRKGAINAERDRLGIIPGSMGAKSFIVKGLGNPDSFNSCSHGAGRKMSRTQAKKHFTIEDLEYETAGVECRKDASVIDEIPSAYKSIEEVMAAQTDLVEVIAEIKQVLCIKG